jgi:hypothetical protein
MKHMAVLDFTTSRISTTAHATILSLVDSHSEWRLALLAAIAAQVA